MESLENIILPNIEITKCTTCLALNKLSLDRCPYVFFTFKMTLNVLNKYYETDNGKQAH